LSCGSAAIQTGIYVIAATLVRRVRARTALASDKAEGLQRAIADGLKKRFTDEKANKDQGAFLTSEEELHEMTRPYLDKNQIVILKEAIASGLRPLLNET
jgi:hypothetical protein